MKLFARPLQSRRSTRSRLEVSTSTERGKCIAQEKLREILGEEFVSHYVATREWEARQSLAAVTDWELERYFEII